MFGMLNKGSVIIFGRGSRQSTRIVPSCTTIRFAEMKIAHKIQMTVICQIFALHLFNVERYITRYIMSGCSKILFHMIFPFPLRRLCSRPLKEDKVVQLYETMASRQCTMVVGPTGGGKTVIISTLIKAQCHLGVPTKCTYLNPKVRN